MTAQISDSVVYHDRRFSIAGINGRGLFEPAPHGIYPVAMHTGCWRGYYCLYRMQHDLLLLDELNVALAPEDALDAKQGAGPSLFGRPPQHSDFAHCFIYNGLNATVPYTGGLLLGADFIDEMYVHMGFHPAYKYREVYELIFEEGRLIERRERSEEMSEFRQDIAHRPLEPTDIQDREQVDRWIKTTFSLQYRW